MYFFPKRHVCELKQQLGFEVERCDWSKVLIPKFTLFQFCCVPSHHPSAKFVHFPTRCSNRFKSRFQQPHAAFKGFQQTRSNRKMGFAFYYLPTNNRLPTVVLLPTVVALNTWTDVDELFVDTSFLDGWCLISFKS
jgi:hypothetical protein